MRAFPALKDGNGQPGRFSAGRAALRRKGGAVLASLLLHLVALAGVVAAMRAPDAVPAGPRTALVTITIRQDTAPHRPSPQRQEARPSAVLRRSSQVLLQAPRSTTPPPALAPAGPVAPSPAKSAPESQTVTPPAAPVPEIRRAPAAGVLDAYRTQLWRRILAARPRGAQGAGKVVVRFHIDRQGRLLLAEIAQSSGQVLLDKLALRAVRAAAPFAPPPPELEESGLVFTVPIDFHG